MGILFTALAFLNPQATVPPELDAYLERPDASFTWKVVSDSAERVDIALTSQTWQGGLWKHTVVLINPSRIQRRGFAILVITGGDPNTADLRAASTLAESAGMSVATLFNIPNQPLFDLNEDALIARTLEKYFETKDGSWPLLFPMTKSAIKAMDALERATARRSNPLKKFVVTGASKRGWTTWLVGASGDNRVAGIAPMVYDNLDIPAQLKHQLEMWNAYSPMISDYTERGLPQLIETPQGKRLAGMIDPYSYRSRIKAPTLIVNGANDPYWTVDALSLYWKELRQPKWATIVPNAGHELGDGRMANDALAAFARSCAGEFKLPSVEMEVAPSGGRLQVSVFWKGAKPLAVRLWKAESPDFRFVNSKWTAVGKFSWPSGSAPSSVRFPYPVADQSQGFFAEAEFQIGQSRFSLCSPVRAVIPS